MESGINRESQKKQEKNKKKKDRQVYSQWYKTEMQTLLNMRQKPKERLKYPNQVAINGERKETEKKDYFSLIHFVISITLSP